MARPAQQGPIILHESRRHSGQSSDVPTNPEVLFAEARRILRRRPLYLRRSRLRNLGEDLRSVDVIARTFPSHPGSVSLEDENGTGVAVVDIGTARLMGFDV